MSRRQKTPGELLFSCLRFVARNSNGTPRPDLKPIPYREKFGDRDPIGFVFPPDRPFSDGANQVWNALCSVMAHENDAASARKETDEVATLLRQVLDETDPIKLRQATVEATRWLHDYDGGCDTW